MFARLVVLFVLVPLVEFYILFKLATWTSYGTTVALVIFTGILGAWLAKRQGISILLKIRREMSEGRLPGQALLDGAMILVAGALLLTPGILTDLFGFSLLMPPCRVLYRKWLSQLPWNVQFHVHPRGRPTADDPSVIDGQASAVEDPPPRDG